MRKRNIHSLHSNPKQTLCRSRQTGAAPPGRGRTPGPKVLQNKGLRMPGAMSVGAGARGGRAGMPILIGAIRRNVDNGQRCGAQISTGGDAGHNAADGYLRKVGWAFGDGRFQTIIILTHRWPFS